MMCAIQIIMLYALSLSSIVCQLYLNKTGRKKIFLMKRKKRKEGRKEGKSGSCKEGSKGLEGLKSAELFNLTTTILVHSSTY